MAGALDDGKYVTMSSLSIVASRATLAAQDIVATSTFSGAAGTFTGVIKVPDGTASAPSYAFTSEASLGLYRSGSSILQLSYGGFKSGQFISATTTSTSATTANQTVQGSLRFSVLSLSTNGAEIAFLSGNTTYRFSSGPA